MKTLIIGYKGEVGGALHEILSGSYEVHGLDLNEKGEEVQSRPHLPTQQFEIMHVCIRHRPDFLDIIRGYVARFRPRIVDICTTVPPGTTRALGPWAVHSTTRGAHPHLAEGLRKIPKHISGPRAHEVGRYFAAAGIECFTNPNPETTEVNHDLNNVHFGLNLMFADLAARYARKHGTDFMEYLNYTQTNNAGFQSLGHPSKVRSVLTPPGGHIGGHCVVPSAKRMLECMDAGDPLRPLVQMLAEYGR